MVGKASSAVIKWDCVFDSPKMILFTPGKHKLAKYIIDMTAIYKMRDHYFFWN